MTRINTNVSSLVAQNTLGRSNASLNQALTRLSTGLRINTGKDDPAGLIASENLRSDITSIRRAISNTDRANQVIATADSALGQVSSLLNDIRGLVTESANSGALSQEQIDANQLQLDSSLDALNRIAQTTTFQGRRLLDGSLDFITQAGSEFSRLSGLQIDQANLGATGQVAVDINVTTAATQAQVDITNITTSVAGTSSTGSLTFSDNAVAASGQVDLPFESTPAAAGSGNLNFVVRDGTSNEATVTVTLGTGGAEASFDVTATAGGTNTLAGTTGNGVQVILDSDGVLGATFTGGNIVVSGVTGATTINQVRDQINTDLGGDDFTIGAVVNGTGTGASTVDAAETSAAGVSNGTLAGGTFGTETRQLTLTTAAGGGLDFNLQINSDLAANISDADAGDGITAGITGSAGTGYVVTIANDETVDLDNLASFLQTQISEVASFNLTGNAANDLNLSQAEAGIGAGGTTTGVLNVTGSQAQVTNTDSIAVNATLAAGASGNLSLSFNVGTVVDGAGGVLDRVAVNGNATDGYVITLDDSEAVTFGDVADALDTIAELDAATTTATTPARVFDTANFNPSSGNTTLTGGRDAGDDVITVTALTQDASFDGNLTFDTANSTIGGIDVTVTGANINVSIDSTSSYNIADIATAINDLTDYSASVTTTNGSGTFENDVVNDSTAPTIANLAGGQASSGGLSADVVLELAGLTGAEVLSFGLGTDINTLFNGINSVSDATGVSATINGTTLELRSSTFGEDSIIDINVRSETDLNGNDVTGTFGTAIGEGSRVVGTNAVATINGIQATTNGNQLSINTATLDLSTSVEANFTCTASFTITGGGALFQLGPDVVSNQQARLGIGSVNTASLGGVSGSLFQLGTGGSAQLTSQNLDNAAAIVEEAITQVTSLRGRLGAFQRTTLETNQNALNDTLVNLTEAESSIRDADFAAESAALTRSQILVQSGTTVLQISNQNPQNVLALLR